MGSWTAMAEAAAAVSTAGAAASYEPPEGTQKLTDDSILFIKKKAFKVYRKLKLRPQKLKWIIYSINTDIEDQFVEFWLLRVGSAFSPVPS